MTVPKTQSERQAIIDSLIAKHRCNEPGALDALWKEIYDEVRRIARSQLRREGPNRPIDTTMLVHELWLKMGGTTFDNRAHFFGSLVRMMGQIIIDASRRASSRRYSDQSLATEARSMQLDTPQLGLAVDTSGESSARVIDALDRLDHLAPRAASVVWLRFVGGLSVGQTALTLDVSERTVKSDWAFARAWLCRELTHDTEQG